MQSHLWKNLFQIWIYIHPKKIFNRQSKKQQRTRRPYVAQAIRPLRDSLSRMVWFPSIYAVRSFNLIEKVNCAFANQALHCDGGAFACCSRSIKVVWAQWADEMAFMNDKYKRAPTPVGSLNPLRLPVS